MHSAYFLADRTLRLAFRVGSSTSFDCRLRVFLDVVDCFVLSLVLPFPVVEDEGAVSVLLGFPPFLLFLLAGGPPVSSSSSSLLLSMKPFFVSLK